MRNTRISAVVFLLASASLLQLHSYSAELPVNKLLVGDKELAVETARTPEQRETGLMYRQALGEDDGMLFLYETPQQVALYMKDTFMPLSCAFIDSGGVILEIRDMEPLDETPVMSVSSEVRFALEVNRGWFDRNGIGPGTQVRTKNIDLLPLF